MDFVTDNILPDEEICNLTEETQKLKEATQRGAKIVVYGRRNVGKTSVLLNRVIPHFKKNHKNSFILFVDFYGVRTLEDIELRIYRSFQLGYSTSQPAAAFLKNILKGLSSLRPTMTIDPVGGPTLSLGTDKLEHPSLEKIFSAIQVIQQEQNCLLIFDEFQDIHHISQAEGILRSHLQQLSHKVPIIMCGSKKHLLSKIFARPKAPFANFGEDLEFKEIAYDDYLNYMQDRFRFHSLSIKRDASIYLQDQMDRVPESINTICKILVQNRAQIVGKKIEKLDVDKAVDLYLGGRRSRFEEYLARFSNTELDVAIALAKKVNVEKPSGKDFLQMTKASQRAVSQIFKKFEDDAVIYRTAGVYALADPLLKFYLQRFH